MSKKREIHPKIRLMVITKYGTDCFYCRVSLIPRNENIALDHIYAESKGGETSIENLVPVCTRCNSQKNTMDMYEWQQKLERAIADREIELERMRTIASSLDKLIDLEIQEAKELRGERMGKNE